MGKEKENTLPATVGPYSVFRVAGNTVFISGQINPARRFDDEVRGAIRKLLDVVRALGLDVKDIVKTTVFLKGERDSFDRMNRIYEKFFSRTKPARSTVFVADLPADARFEIEAVLWVDDINLPKFALRLFELGFFREAHEVWERIWRRTSDADAKHVSALCAWLEHFLQGRRGGKILERLKKYRFFSPEEYEKISSATDTREVVLLLKGKVEKISKKLSRKMAL